MTTYTIHDKAAALGRLYAGCSIPVSMRTDDHYDDANKQIDLLLETAADQAGFSLEEAMGIIFDPTQKRSL